MDSPIKKQGESGKWIHPVKDYKDDKLNFVI